MAHMFEVLGEAPVLRREKRGCAIHDDGPWLPKRSLVQLAIDVPQERQQDVRRLPMIIGVDLPGLATHRRRGQHFVYLVLSPTLTGLPPHVGRRRETGLSPLARTCSRTWAFSWAHPQLGAPFPLFDTVHVRKPRSKKIDRDIVVCECCDACFRRHLRRVITAS